MPPSINKIKKMIHDLDDDEAEELLQLPEVQEQLKKNGKAKE